MNCFGTMNFVKIANSLSTKQIPLHVLLQTGTNQWQQHCKENVLAELILLNYKDYYKNTCSKEFFCNPFGQNGSLPARIMKWACSQVHRNTEIIKVTQK